MISTIADNPFGFTYKNILEVMESVDRVRIAKTVTELWPIGNINR